MKFTVADKSSQETGDGTIYKFGMWTIGRPRHYSMMAVSGATYQAVTIGDEIDVSVEVPL